VPATRTRLRAARTVAAAAAVFWAVFSFGLMDLLVVVLDDDRFAEAYLLETGWGLLFLVLVAVPFAALAHRPGTGLLLVQPLVVAAAVALSAAVAGYPTQLLAAALLVAWVAAVAGLGRSGGRVAPPAPLRARPLRPGPAVLVLVAAPAALVYAWHQVHDWRAAGSPDITLGLDHRPMQGALGLALLGVAVLAALGAGTRPPGWRVPVWTVAVSACWLGLVSAVYPALEGSLGRTLGVAVAVWGVAFAALAEAPVRGRRTAVAR
jgi:hypothetical protein